MPDQNPSPDPAALIPISMAVVADEAGVRECTALRWVIRGLKLPDGRRLKLKAQRHFGRWITSRAWLDEFREAVRRAYEPAGAA